MFIYLNEESIDTSSLSHTERKIVCENEKSALEIRWLEDNDT